MKSKALKSGIWFTVSNFLMKSVGFITTPIFTRLMTQEEFGDFANYQTWLIVLLYITSLNLEGSLISGSQEFKNDLNNYSFSMITLSVIFTVFCCFIFNIFINPISNLLSINKHYINSMFVYLLFTPIISIYQNTERFKFNYKKSTIVGLIVSLSSSFLSVILVVTLSNRLFGRIVGYITPTFFIGIYILWIYLKKKSRVNIKYWKYALPIVLPYIPHLLSMHLLGNMDKLMIRNICGPDQVGLYSLAYTCGTLISILVTSVNSAYAPWLSEKLAIKDYKSIYKYTSPLVMVFCYISIFIVLMAPEVLMILGGKEYIEAKYVIPPVAAGCLLQFVYCFYVNIEQYTKQTKGMAIASFIVASENYLLNLFFIRKFGYIAAAYTTFIGYLSLLFIHMYLVKRLDLLIVYNNKQIIFLTLITCVVLIASTILYNYTLFRYSFVLVFALLFLILMVKYRKSIFMFMRR